ncbi:MAG: hypothetical protein AAFR04_11855 [Pseudomonadota bacterium]
MGERGFKALRVGRLSVKSALAALLLVLALPVSGAFAQCNARAIEGFLEQDYFSLEPIDKIELYAPMVERFFTKRFVTRRAVAAEIRRFVRRWPRRDYRLLSIRSLRNISQRRCRVTFDYRFLAESANGARTSAGIGVTTLVFRLNSANRTEIVEETGTVSCRGILAYRRGQC